MQDYRRYAIYYAPPVGSGLARFGAAWLGWDAEAATETAHPDTSGLDLAALTEMPRRYGFHGTLKSPFRLKAGASAADLAGEVEALAGRIAPFQAAHLTLKRLGRFIALVPSRPSADLTALAAACVRDLDRFREPAEAQELARRRRAGLNSAQEENLVRWGYPYVLGEFRFHLTLTSPITDEQALAVLSVLGPLTAAFCAAPFEVREICLFGERDDGRFHLARRYPLAG